MAKQDTVPDEDRADFEPHFLKGLDDDEQVSSEMSKLQKEKEFHDELSNDDNVASEMEDLKKGDKAKETEGESEGGGLYKPEKDEEEAGVGTKLKGFFWGSRRRRQASITGGIIGIIFGGGVFGITSLSTGPLQFVHLAQLLIHHGSLEDQNDAGDDRLSRIIRYAKDGDIGETRLNILSKTVKDNVVNSLGKKGITLDSHNGSFTDVKIDTKENDSPFKDAQTVDDVSDIAVEQGLNPKYFNITDLGDGVYQLSPEKGILASYIQKFAVNKWLVSQADQTWVPSVVRERVMRVYNFISFKPLALLHNAINTKLSNKQILEKLKEWKENLKNQLSTGEDPTNLNDEGAKVKEANGETESIAGTDNGAIPAAETQSKLTAFAKSPAGTALGGAAFVIGMTCAARELDNNIQYIRYLQDILPLMRMGGEAIAVGSQVYDGQNVDSGELDVLSQQFNSKQGNWTDAQTIQADSGQPLTGQDMNGGLKSTLSQQSIPWLAWTKNAAVGDMCTGAGAAFTTAIGVTLSVIGEGSVVTAGLQFVAQSLVSGKIISYVSHALAGDAVNVLASGPEYGNDVSYGSQLLGNAMATQQGGVVMSNVQVGQRATVAANLSRQQFATESLADRYFDIYDYRSMISQLMDKISPSAMQNFASLGQGLLGVFKTVALLPFKLISSIADASTPTVYTYPFPEVGFSQADLNNPMVENPYTNAAAVANLLNGPNGQTYITEAYNCFVVNIQKVNGDWDVVPDQSAPVTAFDVYNTANYPSYCDSNDPNWLRIRFFILDTGIAEGYACEVGDAQSCQNDGVEDESNSTSGSSSTTTTPTPTTGSASFNFSGANSLAKQFNSNGTELGYALYDSSGDLLGQYNQNFENFGASITKSMLLVAYLNQEGSTKLSATAQGEVTNMIVNSDNASANWVFDHLKDGQKQVEAVATSAGMTGFKFNDTSDNVYVLGQSQITANDFAKFFAKIPNLINSSQKQFGLNLLANLAPSDQVGLLNSLAGTVYSKEGWKPESPGSEGTPYIVNQAANFTINGKSYGVAVTVGGIQGSSQTTEKATGEQDIQQLVSELVGS